MNLPALIQGHLVHPDIWMLWFSFFVSAAIVGAKTAKAVWWLIKKVMQ